MFRRADQIKLVDRIDYFPVRVSESDIEALYSGELGSLILESVDVADIEGAFIGDLEYVPDMMLEAIKAKASKLGQRMKAFTRALNQQLAPIDMTAGEAEIGKPRKSAAVAVQVAKIPLSDGQSVSLVFHAPDNDPLKINNDDMLIAFRFLVNSSDVTHLVAPSGGRDISLKQTALALANVVEKNAPKFAQAQAKKKKQQAELEQVKEQIDAAEAAISSLGEEVESVEALKLEREKKAKRLQAQIDNQNDIQAELRKQLEAKQKAQENAAGNEDKLKELFRSPKLKAASDLVLADGNGRIFQSLATIADIDVNGAMGTDRSLIASNMTKRIKTIAKNESQDKVDNILTMLNEYNKVADKPAITLRNAIWKLGEPKKVDATETPTDGYKVVGDRIDVDGELYTIENVDIESRTIMTKDERGNGVQMDANDLNALNVVVKGINDTETLRAIKEAEKAKADELAQSKAKAKAQAEAITKDQVDYVKSISNFRKTKEEHMLMGDPDGEGEFYLTGIKIADEYAEYKFYTDDQQGFDSLVEAKKWSYKLAALGLIAQGYKVPPAKKEQEPQPEANNNGLKSIGDYVVIGDGSFVIDSIHADSQKVTFLDRETQEKFEMTGEALREKGIFVKGIHSEEVASGVDPLVAELKPFLKDLPTTDWFTPKDKMTFTGFDAIYDALVANGYGSEDARIKGRQVMDRHNMGELDYFTHFTDGKPEPVSKESGVRTEEEMSLDLSKMRGLFTAGFQKKNKSKTLVSMKVHELKEAAGKIGAELNDGIYVDRFRIEVRAAKTTYFASVMSNVRSDEPRYIVATQKGTGKADTPEEVFAEIARIDGYEKREEAATKQNPIKPESAPNAGNSAAEMVRTVLSELDSGAITLKQAKDRVRTNGEIPESLQGMVKAVISTMRKPRFMDEGKSLLKALEQYDENAPSATVDGKTYSLNDFSYNIMDELGRFGDNLASVAKDYPNKAIEYLESDLDGLSAEVIDALREAIISNYVAGGAPTELDESALDEESKAQLDKIKEHTDFKLVLGKQVVTLPTGIEKTITTDSSDDAMDSIDRLYDLLEDDLKDFAEKQLEVLVDKSTQSYYNQEGNPVTFNTSRGVNFVYGDSKPAGAYSPVSLSAMFGGSQHGLFNIYPISDGGYKFLLTDSHDERLGEFESFDELEALIVELNGFSTEKPEPPQEDSDEVRNISKLQEIRDYAGEPSIEKAEEFQAALEAAYASFEELGVLQEHNDLLEAAFENHVKLQSELKV